MKDDDLRDVLQHPDIPDLDDAVRERIVSSAAIRFRHAAAANGVEVGRTSAGRLIALSKPLLAAAAALVFVVMLRNVWPTGDENVSSPDLAADSYNMAVFREYRTLFQDELMAVVARDGDIDVVLGSRATRQVNPLVLIRLEADGQPVYITAYSGQTIEAEIGGRHVTLDILTTTDREVVLASDEFMLERDVWHGPANVSADAHVLELSL